MNLLSNILFYQSKSRKSSKYNFQLVFSFIVTLIGIVTLLLSVLLLNDLSFFKGDKDELFDENTIIIQKKVTKFTSLGLNSTEFTSQEVEEIKNKPFVTEVAPFKSSNCSVVITEYPGDGLPPFAADMFFQSVNDKFIDVNTRWEWHKNSDYVPIILPRQFLLLFNYGIAQSQGLPQVSEDFLSSARMRIHLKGKKNSGVVTGKVVGLSHKISSVLVPESFLEYANKTFGDGEEKDPQRLFVSIKDGSFNELEQLMQEMNLDINQQDLMMTKIKTVVQVIISLFLILSVIIVLLAIFNLVQYSLLLLNKSKKEISLLFLIGYTSKSILKTIITHLIKMFGIITLFAVIITLTIKFIIINPFLISSGMNIGQYQMIITILIAFSVFLMFIIFNFITLKKALKKL